MSPMNKKNLSLKKFDTFLNEEKEFFKTYKKIYIINFVKLIKKNYPQIKIKEEIQKVISNFYDTLFLNPAFKNNDFKYLIKMKDFFQENNLKKDLINKTFLLLVNNYIKYIFQSSNLKKLKILIYLLDFYYDFLNVQIKEEITISKIPTFLKELYENKSTIVLFSVYKGIPISNQTKIISVNQNSIDVNANRHQLIASKFQKEIYLLHMPSNKTFKAYIQKTILPKKILTLSNIEQIERSALKRNNIRVQPKEKIKANVIINGTQFTGDIYDISINGISIIYKKALPVNINDIALIKFKLEKIFSFYSELKSISNYNNFYRYHFYFEPSSPEDAELARYIAKREQEIIQELTEYLNREFIDF